MNLRKQAKNTRRTLEEVDHDRVVPLTVYRPFEVCCDHLGQPAEVSFVPWRRRSGRRRIEDEVQVFVQSV